MIAKTQRGRVFAVTLYGVLLAASACSSDVGGSPFNWPSPSRDASSEPALDSGGGGGENPDPESPPGNQADSGRPTPWEPLVDAGHRRDSGSPPDSPMDAAIDASTGGGGRILPPVTSTDADGPFETTIDEGRDNWVFRPAELGKDGLKHPVFVWGTGSTAVPRQYTDHFNRMASHGFVIVAPTPSQLNGRLMKASLDWILAENERSGTPYYQKLDPDRVAMGGHSQGSTSTFDVEGDETRLKTTIHIAGGSFDGSGSSNVRTPTAYICGETDIALSNCKRDFQNVKDQPTFFSELSGVDHIQCARAALPGMISWLRWHLAGETERAAEFTGPDGFFHQGIWKSQTKNWQW